MSTNHFTTNHPEAPWWTQQQNNTMFCAQNSAFSFNLNHDDDEDEELEDQLMDEKEKEEEEEEEEELIPKEALFEKPLTPSDVGKLNRLVIPKQNAEKYFPLSGGGGGGGVNDSGEKGLLLNFEDELGKSWRFRYSYWNSSQSYVLTKGWSRFVKEKRLDAGDIVTFERHRIDGDRFFIGWRRRNTPMIPAHDGVAQPAGGGGSGGGWNPMLYAGNSYPSSHSHGSQLPYQPHCLHAGSVVQKQGGPSGVPKRLRLFGVNLECQPDESEPSTPNGSSISSHGPAHNDHQYQDYSKSHSSYDHHNDHMVSPHILLALDHPRLG